jgi:hypothetical protein
VWFREIEVPTAALEAHRAGKLVLFVGAGVSRDAPSDLPDFRALSSGIAAEAGIETTAADLEWPDVLLGRIADRDVDIHRRVAARLGRSGSVPNRLHTGLARLAIAAPSTRIVTTNYDLHLSTALTDAGADFDEYAGPALPMGNDFQGIVYLHGSLRQEPRRLVVTEGDFGRAYLTDAWAARFLERMFAEYMVLFIGYSHSDVVMRYLARALRPGTRRYVLTPSPDSEDWRHLGINAIGYEVRDGSHRSLVDAIEEWSSLASMGLLDHRQRIAQLVSSPPSQVPHEDSYLESVIEDTPQAYLFADLARGSAWLSWAASRHAFRRLFDGSTEADESTSPLSEWFAQHYVMDEALSPTALAVVADVGGGISAPLWFSIARQLHVQGRPRPHWLGPWLVLLVANDPGFKADWLEYALVASSYEDDSCSVLLLFDYLTEPQTYPRASLRTGGVPQFDVALRGSHHWLEEAWRSVIAPNLAAAAASLASVADHHLRRSHYLLTTTGSASTGWDPITFRRSAVEPHPQDRHRGAVDILIDAARDSLECLLTASDGLGASYVSAWADSGVPILHRLAVHGWMRRQDVDDTAKVSWLLEQGWLFDRNARHEVFRLIQAALPTADPQAADRLVSEALAGPDDEVDAERRAYQAFNAVSWMSQCAPDLASAREALDEMRTRHPSFEEREHPDLRSWVEVGSGGTTLPITVEDLHGRIQANAPEALTEVLEYQTATPSFDGPRWEDALALVTDTVHKHPADGLTVLDATGRDHPDLIQAVISAWAQTAIEPDLAQSILDRLVALDPEGLLAGMSDLLASGTSGSNSTEWQRYAQSRSLATRLWAEIDVELPDAVDNWLGVAINSPAGRIAEYWLNVVAAEWRAAGDEWVGIPHDTRCALETLLDRTNARTDLAEVVLASQVHFFFAADSDWCGAHILPLLDWNDPARAKRTWDGYLSWGRWSERLLGAGLLDEYLAAVAHIGEFQSELRSQLCRHLAAVSVQSELELLQWIRSLTQRLSIPHRVEWMSAVGWMVAELPPAAVEHQWQRWMQRYWRDRLESVPVRLTVEEASSMANWVPYLSDSLPEGVALATAAPASLTPHGDLLRSLDETRLRRAPEEFARLLAHLLRSTDQPFWGGPELARLVPILRDGAAPSDIDAIREQGIRLGYTNAAQW